MKELAKNFVFETEQNKKITKYHIVNKTNLIEFDNYFKYSGLIEYKKRFIKPEDNYEYQTFERKIIKNDMSKYQLKNKFNETDKINS